MTDTQLDVADRLAMYVGGGLIMLGIPVTGILNVLAGAESPLFTYEVTKGGETTTGQVLAPALAPEGASIIHSPLIGPNARAYLVALGLLVFGLYGVYRLADHREKGGERTERAATAD